MHAEAHRFVERALAALPTAPSMVLELGSRSINGGVRELLPPQATYLGIDQLPGPGVDVLADAASYQLIGTPDATGTIPYHLIAAPDLVLCLEVLEHSPQGAAILANAARLLAPGGVLLLTCATEPREPHSTVDGGNRLYSGEWYQNVSRVALEDWLHDACFAAWRITEDRAHGDLYVLATR